MEKSTIYDGLWMMKKDDVDWCISHEKQILDTMFLELDKGGMEMAQKYAIGGRKAKPPDGFPEKTAYYVGYRAIGNLIKIVSIQDLFELDTQTAIDRCGLFN